MELTLDDIAASTVDAPAPDTFVTPNHKASRDTGETANSSGARKRPGIFASGARDKPYQRKARVIKADVPYHKGEYTEAIATAYEVLGAAIVPFDPHCGTIIGEQAEKAAEAWDAAAEKSPRLRRFLKMATTGSTWGAVVAANAPIVIAALSHHTPIVESAQRRMMTFMAQRAQSMQDEQD